MNVELEKLLAKYELSRIESVLKKYVLPCVTFELNTQESSNTIRSKIGGNPDLPEDFVWSENNGRPLDFLLQINLSETSKFDPIGLLPTQGLLSFFYDLEEQPWGFDPKDLNGYKVAYFSDTANLKSRDIPDSDYKLEQFGLSFSTGTTVPYVSSDGFDLFEEEAGMTDEERDNYFDFSDEYSEKFSRFQNSENMDHRLLGHSKNIQGGMQVEAQLVMNGYYCGEPFSDQDPEREKIQEGYKDWILLLQLDSDDKGGFMWGDSGMLYFWIRKNDLLQKNFDRVWLGLQCY